MNQLDTAEIRARFPAASTPPEYWAVIAALCDEVDRVRGIAKYSSEAVTRVLNRHKEKLDRIEAILDE